VDRLPGAQAVVLDGRMRTLKSGLGDLERGTPMPGADGYLRGASNLKSMVATVILQLVAEGKITLDAPVATYLPGLIPPGAGDEHKIEIRHLLQHTSGIHNHSEEITYGEDLKPYKHYTRPDLLNLSFAKAPDFPPGEPGRWHYSNTGYVLLGMVIEKVTGHAWRDEVKARVFDPAAMTDTYFPGDYEYGIRAPRARGYLQLPMPGGGIATADVTDYDTSGGDAAGAGNTTSRDLLRFYTALLGGKLVRPDLLAEMKRYVSTPDPRLKLGYGLGLGHFTLPCGGEAWGNGGNTEGFQTLSGVVLDDHGHITRAATVFTNTTFNESNVDGALDQFQALYAALC
jgi:D-alanyl-D-alanine carboxypeptidase